MKITSNNRFARILWPFMVGICYFILARISIHATYSETAVAILWPTAGFSVAILLMAKRSYWPYHLLAFTIASLAANLSAGSSVYISTVITIINIFEALAVMFLLKYFGGLPLAFTDMGKVLKFLIAAVISALLCGFAAMITINKSMMFFVSWFTTDLMGMMIVTPFILIIWRSIENGYFTKMTHRDIVKLSIMFIIAALTSIIVFMQSSYPLLFVPIVCVLWATFYFGLFGAITATFIVAVVMTIFTGYGMGVAALLNGGEYSTILFLQFYLMLMLASVVPLALMMKSREEMLAKLTTHIGLLHQAEEAANVGHWHSSFRENKVFWSSQTARIHGREPGYAPEVSKALHGYHPDDMPRVESYFRDAIKTGETFEYEARIIRADGEERHVYTKGKVQYDKRKKASGFFGVIQDITRQIKDAKILEQARQQAEEAARKYHELANTDSLTGVHNRRYVMEKLQNMVDKSALDNEIFSICILDIDHFKKVNDTYGHQVGDQVIQNVCQHMQSVLRDSDSVGRIGGEEFIMLLPKAGAIAAMSVSERIRQNIIQKSKNSTIAGQVTVSMGIAVYKPGVTMEELVYQADNALYQAKDSGRNRLILAA